MTAQPLKRTPLSQLHRAHGAKFVPFAGYEMPLHYADGVLAEHKHTRECASLFDISHMGQAWLEAIPQEKISPRHECVAGLIESLVPGEIIMLKPGRMRYSLLLSGQGGILDDLMITRPDEDDRERLFLVVNAAAKDTDFAHIESSLAARAKLKPLEDRALLALQGPKSAQVLEQSIPSTSELEFMQSHAFDVDGRSCLISRSGYTGEDGFEISVPATLAQDMTRALLSSGDVKFAGLGARDSLRLEAGLCLYGHDLTSDINPVEAGLVWTIGKRRREKGGFPGAARILRLLQNGCERRRVGLVPQGRAPARKGTVIQDRHGGKIGYVTSGTYGPTYGGPIAMGYIARAFSEPGTEIQLVIRGVPRPARVTSLPFVPHRYHRKG